MLESQIKGKNQQSIYQKLFGGQKRSPAGPLFFLISGFICLFIGLLLIWITGSYDPGVLGDSNTLRPDVIFPYLSLLLIFILIGAIVGIIWGSLGIIWFLTLESRFRINEKPNSISKK